MLAAIDGLPDQLEAAWALGRRLPLGDITGVGQVVLAGMGGSAIGADLVAAYVMPMLTVPVVVWRDYDLPGFAMDERTLVVVSSHSGNTEESLSALAATKECGAQCVAITTGGALAQAAAEMNAPVWEFEHSGQPRAAVGYSFGLLLALFSRLGLIPDPEQDVLETLIVLRDQQARITAEVPVVEEPRQAHGGAVHGTLANHRGCRYA